MDSDNLALVVPLRGTNDGPDVLTQAGIIEEIRGLRDERDVAMLYVARSRGCRRPGRPDRGLLRRTDRGTRPHRTASARPASPLHTRADPVDPDPSRPRKLIPMRGTGAGVGKWPAGCPFEPRCPQRIDACTTAVPPLEPAGDDRGMQFIRWRNTPPVDLGNGNGRGQGGSARSGAVLLDVQGLVAAHRGADTVVAAGGHWTRTCLRGRRSRRLSEPARTGHLPGSGIGR